MPKQTRAVFRSKLSSLVFRRRAPPSGGQTHFFFPFEKETVLDAKEKGALTGAMARGAGKRQTASFVFPPRMSTIPGRYGLRKWNRDAAQLYPGDAWRYGELAGVRTGAGARPRGVSPIGGPRPP